MSVTVENGIEKNKNDTVDLEEALAISGFGWYNVKIFLLLGMFLVAAIMEPLGYSYVLPAARCDLGMTDRQRGFISSVPYIAVVTSSFPWGYLVDTQGRRKILLISSFAAGGFGVLAALMPDLVSFAVCKFLCALCMTGAAAIPYTYIGEMLPQKYRDVSLSVVNAIQTLGSALVPLIAWGILPLEFNVYFGAYNFRSWRLLAILNSSGLVICPIFLIFQHESPKYLMSQGRHVEALAVFQKMYAANNKTSKEHCPIKNLTMNTGNANKGVGFLNNLRNQSLPLVKFPYVQWLCLNSFLLFGIFSTLNGLAIWVPDVLNRVLSGDNSGSATACQVIGQRFDEASDNTACTDSIDPLTFVINTVANVACAVIALIASTSVQFIGKKTLLFVVYASVGCFLVSINFINNGLVFATLLSLTPITALGIGCVSAYSVQIFPTHLRGMAVGLSMMFGRLGSIMGTNVAGVMLNQACEATFYFFGGLLLLCGLTSFLLPKNQKISTKEETKQSIENTANL